MNRRVIEALPAQITLRAHPSAPARVELAFQPLRRRCALSLLSLLACWGAIPLALAVPLHFAWVLALLAAGTYLGRRFWTGRYQVCAFSGCCPRCGRSLELRAGTRISLPYTLACHGCRREPRLEVRFTPAPPPPETVADHSAECTGEWRRVMDARGVMLVCSRCNASHPATPASVRATDAENHYSQLLTQLTTEGRSLL